MKKNLLFMATALLALASCSEENLLESPNIQNKSVLTATFEQDASATRVNIAAGDNALSWSAGDAIAVFGTSAVKYENQTGTDGIFVIEEGKTVPETISGAAFPYSENVSLSENTLTMTLPSEIVQTTAGELDMPMWGTVNENNNVSFKHLAGVLKVNLNDVPEGYNTLTVTTSNAICGEFTADITTECPVLSSESTDEANKTVTVNFTANESNTIYLPLPVGKYASIVVSINGAEKEDIVLKNWTDKEVKRAEIYSTSAECNTYVTTAEQLKDAIAAGGTVNLGANIEVSEVLWIKKSLTMDLNGNALEGTADRLIRIATESDPIQVTIKNGTILNETEAGRCVETRSGNVKLTLESVTLTTPGTGANQPFTVGGSGADIEVDILNSEIVTNNVSGYAITTFNPVEMNVTNSSIEGWCALNIKAANSSLGSSGSVFNVVNSTLKGTNVVTEGETNGFTTIMIEDKNVTVNVDESSKVEAKATNSNEAILVGIGNESLTKEQNAAITGTNVTFAKGTTLTLTGENALPLSINEGANLVGNSFKFPDTFKEVLAQHGWITSESTDGLVEVTGKKEPEE